MRMHFLLASWREGAFKYTDAVILKFEAHAIRVDLQGILGVR
jgi:hypothetical protein